MFFFFFGRRPVDSNAQSTSLFSVFQVFEKVIFLDALQHRPFIRVDFCSSDQTFPPAWFPHSVEQEEVDRG